MVRGDDEAAVERHAVAPVDAEARGERRRAADRRAPERPRDVRQAHRARLDEPCDPVDHLVERQLGRVDLDRVRRAVRVDRVALVAAPELLGELVDLEAVALEVPPARAHGRVRDEPDLDLRVRDDDDADVAPLDHGVAGAAELPLAPAHDLAHLGMAGDDRDGGVDLGLADAGRDVLARDRDRCPVAERDGIAARAPRARAPSSSGTPSCSASHVSARYIAPVSR